MNSRWSRFKHGLTRNAQIGIVVIIIVVIAVGGYVAIVLTSTKASTTSGPTAPSGVLTDEGQLGTPDSLDPANGFFTTDQPVFTSVFQQLFEFNGSQFSGASGGGNAPGGMIPVIASSVSYNGTTKYVYTIRPGVTFSNGDPVSAATVWYSWERIIFLNSPSGTAPSNYAGLTYIYNSTSTFEAASGLTNAICSVNKAVPCGLTSSSGENTQVAAIESVLNSPSNSSIAAIMSYPNQAYVVNSTANTITANMILPYAEFTQDIGAWWGAIVDPTFVTANGGVANNTGNTYFTKNGGPGTGPYEITSATGMLGTGTVTVDLALNPNYWAPKVMSTVPYMIQVGHIARVVINFGEPENVVENDFGTNKAQIATVGVPSIQALWAAYTYKSFVHNNYKNLLNNTFFAPYPGEFSMSLNTQKAPTNNVFLREAMAWSYNYTELYDALFVYNGTNFAPKDVGPLTSGYSQYPTSIAKFWPDNIATALGYMEQYLSLTNEFTVLPNNTKIGPGCSTGTCNSGLAAMPPVTFDYISPITPELQTQIQLVSQMWAQIGVTLSVAGETETQYSTFNKTPQGTPNMVNIGWIPDWPDPVFQLMYQVLTSVALQSAWPNSTYVNDILLNCATGFTGNPGCNTVLFTNDSASNPNSYTSLYGPLGIVYNSNQAQVQAGINALYQWDYLNVPYLWFPNTNQYFFVQPYLTGMYFNGFTGYAYNTISYT